ncbi:Cytochrome P450 71D8 [Glycine max]|nr:Cytochrome P450 71D8 [Glycine max]
MEYSPLSIVITFFVFLLLHWLVKIYKQKSSYKLPPSPWRLPIIGNLHQLALAASLPDQALQKLVRKYGPLMHLQLGEISTLVVSSPKMAMEVMKTHDVHFVQRPQLLAPQFMVYGATDIVFAPYGDYWRQIRKICTLELLSAKRVQSFSHIRQDENRKLIQSIHSSAGSSIDLSGKLFSLLGTTVSRAAFGKENDDQDELMSLVRKAITMTGGFELDDMFPSLKPLHLLTRQKAKVEHVHQRADKILEDILRKHMEKRTIGKEGSNEAEQEDLVDVLLRLKESGSLEVPMTMENIKAVIWNIFASGTDTPASTLEWAMSEMMKNPRVREKAQAELRQTFKGKEIIRETDLEELSYLKSVIKETLRLHPPSQLIPRECIKSTNIDGYDIPIKTKVMINTWAIGRDPEYWSDAERFIPERFDDSSIDFKGNSFEYIPFGAGRRMCPGITFGLASITLPLALLLYYFNWELPNKMKPADLDMDELFGLTVNNKITHCYYTFFLFLLLHWLIKKYKSKSSHTLSPGPRKLPLIGTCINLLTVAGSLQYHALRELAHKYEPLMHLQLCEISAVINCILPQMVAKEIMKTHDLAFVQPQLLSPQILAYGATNIAFAPYGAFGNKSEDQDEFVSLPYMEAQTYFLVIALSLFILLNWLAKYLKLKPNVAHKLPPGPKKLPLIGNMHQLAVAGSLPHRALQKLAHIYGPLMHLQLGEISAVRPQFLPAQILTYGQNDIVFAPYGDYWRQMKKICVSELLSAKRVQSFSHIREDETSKFIESIRISEGSPINLTSKIYSLVSSSVSRVAFGDKSKDQEEFLCVLEKMILAGGGFEPDDLFPSMKLHLINGRKAKLEKMHEQVDKIADNILREHQEKRERALREGKVDLEEEDLVDVLLRIQQSDNLEIKISTTNIKAVILDVFTAGTDTSASTLEWAMAEMMRNPRVREKAQAEVRQAFRELKIIHETDVGKLTYLKLVIKETLRLHAPSPLLVPRECSELTIIDGYEIPVKTKVMINVWAIGRDPQYWTDAERFVPERFDGSSIDFKGNNFEYLPFGAGRRMCPGMTFGLANIMLPLALLLYHFNWELPNEMKPEDMDMSENFGLTVTRKSELCLIPIVRNDITDSSSNFCFTGIPYDFSEDMIISCRFKFMEKFIYAKWR